MDGIPGHVEPWSGYGQLDAYYRGMLNLPDPALGSSVADLLADASHAGASGASLAAELNRAGAQEALPPVIDFGVFQAAQQDQEYSGNYASLEDDDLLQAALPEEQKAVANHPRATRRASQAQSVLRSAGMGFLHLCSRWTMQ